MIDCLCCCSCEEWVTHFSSFFCVLSNILMLCLFNIYCDKHTTTITISQRCSSIAINSKRPKPNRRYTQVKFPRFYDGRKFLHAFSTIASLESRNPNCAVIPGEQAGCQSVLCCLPRSLDSNSNKQKVWKPLRVCATNTEAVRSKEIQSTLSRFPFVLQNRLLSNPWRIRGINLVIPPSSSNDKVSITLRAISSVWLEKCFLTISAWY